MNLRESAGKAMFAVDWPKDSWERLGDGYHQDRYRKMAAAAILAMFDYLAEHVCSTWKDDPVSILQFRGMIIEARKEYEKD